MVTEEHLLGEDVLSSTSAVVEAAPARERAAEDGESNIKEVDSSGLEADIDAIEVSIVSGTTEALVATDTIASLQSERKKQSGRSGEGTDSNGLCVEQRQQKMEEQEGDIEVALGVLRLPGRKPISNCCAICLEVYEAGDSVVWSTNHNCQHVFHKDCIANYCVANHMKQTSGMGNPRSDNATKDNSNPFGLTPCPICRQYFDCTIQSAADIQNNDKGEFSC